jgi:multisubunit Na+/H+ antiporter MnhE subunit
VVYICAITFLTIPENSVRFADTILGFLLGTIVATILQFFFGSSKSSKDKTDLMMKGMK